MLARQLIESTVDHQRWANIAHRHTFPSERVARDWVYQRLGSLGRLGDPQEADRSRRQADAMPLYQAGHRWKVGKRPKPRPFKPDVTFVGKAALISDRFFEPNKIVKVEKGWKPPTWFKTQERVNDHDARNLALKIKATGAVRSLVAHRNGQLVDGRLRLRALEILGLKRLPVSVVITADD